MRCDRLLKGPWLKSRSFSVREPFVGQFGDHLRTCKTLLFYKFVLLEGSHFEGEVFAN